MCVKINQIFNDALLRVLKSKRLSLELSQSELAQRLEVQQSFVSKIESGERHLEFSEVFEICAILEIDFRILIEEVLKEFRSMNEAKSKISK